METLETLKSKLEELTPKESLYFRMMWPKSGVLYITSKPGVAKSSIAKSIADKMGFAYYDLRLSMVDETDVGLYPNVSTLEGGIKCLDFVVPRWAIEANKKPTIIHFEELNRASQQVRNAALQILLERQIGIDFKFNDNVLMMSSGNLGDEDGTDVEEFDSALNNRLIHFNHTLDAKEWVDNFASKNCHSLIVSYLSANPDRLYQAPNDNTRGYATPRSWTFLSNFIIENFGKDSMPSEFITMLRQVASSYVGNSAMKFVQYCEDMINLTIKDIINNFDKVEKDLAKYNRDKTSELIHSLKEIDLRTLSKHQLANVTKFLNGVSKDELTAYLLHIIDSSDDLINDQKVKDFLVQFRTLLVDIKRLNNANSSKK